MLCVGINLRNSKVKQMFIDFVDGTVLFVIVFLRDFRELDHEEKL